MTASTRETGTILVTGGAGYIGSHACKALARAGYLPVTFDNLSTGHSDAVKWGPLVVGDIRNAAKVASVLAEFRPVAIMHFAALAYVGESVERPAEYYSTNVVGMHSLLECARQARIGKIVFSSSCATYGIPERLPIVETTPQAPINPYGRTKLVCEMMLRDFAAAYGFEYALLRYFNVAGADPDGDLVEHHVPETHLVPRVLMAANGVIDALDILGDDYPTPDGTCIRDYVHVSDLANGHVLALQHSSAGCRGAVFNLGAGTGYSVRQILDAAQRITGKAVNVRLAPRRPGDPPALVADISKAREHLGYTTELSSLESIIATANRSVQTVWC